MSHPQQRVLIGALAAGVPADAHTVLLDLGVDHPTRAGLLELRLETADGVITRARIAPGAMHRGVEKLFEVRDPRQILMLADRHDWQAPFFGELAAVLCFEELLRLEPAPRATWLRTLLAEHTRALSHLGFLGWPVRDDPALLDRLRRAREALREQTRRLTGNRIHPMAARLGGLACDPDADWLRAEVALTEELTALAHALGDRFAATRPGAGVAPVSAAQVDSFGLSGPLARAGGVPLDLRVDAPYLAYAELRELLTPAAIPGGGDAAARFALLAAELERSAALVAACCDALPTGPVAVKLPKIVKLPEGSAYTPIEAPLGRAGFHLVSRGGKTPWRMKLRSPSFHHVAALEEILLGCPSGEVEAALASIGYVIGDVAK